MLEQFIMGQLQENDAELDQLKNRLFQLEMEEESCSNAIRKLTEQEDLGMELFSPRNAFDSTHTRISDLKKQLAGIKLEQDEISEKISQAQENETNYQRMLSELRGKRQKGTMEKQQERSPSMGSGQQEAWKEVLERVETCLTLLYKNKSQCKQELINLKYYIKALICDRSDTGTGTEK